MTDPSIKCPFCRKVDISCEPGVHMCPVCLARFRMDDRGECMYVSLDSFDVDVLQEIFKSYIIAKTGLEPEEGLVKAAWEKLRKSHKLRSVK